MRFTTAVLSSLTLWTAQHAHVASAFGGPSLRHRAFVATSTRGISSTTQLHANVLKLSDPMSQVLDKTDVFIFDCDGVIWRVRAVLYYVCVFKAHCFVHLRSLYNPSLIIYTSVSFLVNKYYIL